MRVLVSFLLLFVGMGLLGCGGDQSEADRMAEEHANETPSATEAVRTPESPVRTDTVSYTQTPSGSPVTGYMAAPVNVDSVLSAHGQDPASAHLPGIVVIHEWWGLNDNVRAATRRLAGQGYRALAVDLYRGGTASTSDSARALMEQAMGRKKQLLANLRDAYEYLRSNTEAPRVAVLGWCFGGGRTYDAVAASPTRYDAAVAYYGAPGSMTVDVLRKTTTPILAHFGRKDQAVSVDAARAFEARVQKTEANVQVHFYDAGHAFANPSGESYVPAAAEKAWGRTTAFLSRHLYP